MRIACPSRGTRRDAEPGICWDCGGVAVRTEADRSTVSPGKTNLVDVRIRASRVGREDRSRSVVQRHVTCSVAKGAVPADGSILAELDSPCWGNVGAQDPCL